MRRALLLIDIQTGMDDPVLGARNNPGAEANAARLLARYRGTGAPLVHIRHLSKNPASSLYLGKPGTAFKPEVAPQEGETVFEKATNSAFIGTPLDSHLREWGVEGVVIAGLSTPQCVSTSARMAANLGFDVWLAHDACAAFDTHASNDWAPEMPPLTAQQIHDMEICILHGEFVTARSTQEIIDSPL
ncbi:Nicotinamidase-related amidase [Salinihabitans flavidus]|uniref:Nicotinamidase-related amidase n=1 Tax=Salinihabitans flavidus TaxID=569882 RepID=A0A1H8SQY7_9RHOB|nr:cysteine hydrolase family protein [Salinihabitans flavidus]SEO81132.1 Nicotinamidase-related amidase [Salinihabitans flavidus]